MEIPAQVIAAAADLTSQYEPRFELLGKLGSQDVYMFLFPDGEITGFPFLYLFEDGEVSRVTGFQAVRILRSLGIE